MISGSTQAKCKQCNCRILWHVDSMPSMDAEFIFTCENCLYKKDHDCVDEFTEVNGTYAIVGRKIFKRDKKKYEQGVDKNK